MLKQGHKDPIRFTRAEFLLLLNEAKKLSTKINWYAIFVSYGITGMRRDELRYLKCKDVHLGGKVAYIHCDETKTGNPKDVPIHPQLLPVLHDIMGGKNPEDYVFTNTKGNHFHKHDFTKQLKRICKRLGILPKKAHLHTLRRTFASISLEKKMPAGAVQKIGGWKDREVMERHYVGVEKDWAVEQYFKVDYLEELNGK